MKDIPDNLIRMAKELIRLAGEIQVDKPSFESFEDCVKEYKNSINKKPDCVVMMAVLKGGDNDYESKLQAIAREIIVSTVLNGDANDEDKAWCTMCNAIDGNLIHTTFGHGIRYGYVRYVSKEAAEKAIEILGEETIKRARI